MTDLIDSTNRQEKYLKYHSLLIPVLHVYVSELTEVLRRMRILFGILSEGSTKEKLKGVIKYQPFLTLNSLFVCMSGRLSVPDNVSFYI